jgi:hypothetical protein
MAEWHQCQRHKLDVLFRDGQANNRYGKQYCEDKMHDGQFKPRQDDPDDVHDQCDGAARWLGFRYLTAERGDDAAGKSETHEAEWNANDCEAQQDATKDVAKENYEAAEYKKYEVAE